MRSSCRGGYCSGVELSTAIACGPGATPWNWSSRDSPRLERLAPPSRSTATLATGAWCSDRTTRQRHSHWCWLIVLPSPVGSARVQQQRGNATVHFRALAAGRSMITMSAKRTSSCRYSDVRCWRILLKSPEAACGSRPVPNRWEPYSSFGLAAETECFQAHPLAARRSISFQPVAVR